MSIPINALILLAVIILALYFIVSNLQGKPGLQTMVLGIEITLIGGIIAVDPNSNLGGIEYIFVLIGLVLNIVGFK